ncbi:MAG: hypothetical protein K8S16_18275 [Bacteroidales bacterium]|nr:hypothetical protein [Bacteroidales bacterium]
MKFNRRYVLIIILVGALVTLFLPIKVHYSFKATAKIYPVREWHLKRGQDDSYIGEMRNYQTNVLSHVKSYKFERGDISEILLLNDLVSGDLVERGDTLAYINSYFIENELTKLYNQKAIEEKNLGVKLAGEKQELIDEATQRYNFAKQQRDLEEKNFNRHFKLYNDSIISTADFEVVENSFQLAEIKLELVQKEMISLRAGAKDEEIAYIQKKISGYKREIETYERLEDQYNIVSPVGGIITFNKIVNGIIAVSDTSKYILKIPVKVNNIQYLDRISGIRFSIPGYEDEIDASFIMLDESVVSLLSNQQLVMAKAVIAGGQFKLFPGMAVQCTVVCDKISLFAFLSRSILLRL